MYIHTYTIYESVNMFHKWLITHENFSALTLSKPTASAGFPTISNVIFRISTNTKNVKQMEKMLAVSGFYPVRVYLFLFIYTLVLYNFMRRHEHAPIHKRVYIHLYLFSIFCIRQILPHRLLAFCGFRLGNGLRLRLRLQPEVHLHHHRRLH